MVACEDSQIFNFIPAGTAAVCAVVADEGAIAEEEEVRIGVEEGPAGVASETVQMPSIASCRIVRSENLNCSSLCNNGNMI